MGISKYPSIVTLPNVVEPYPSILDFLSAKFPHVQRDRWEERLNEGKILDEESRKVTSDMRYIPLKRLFYFREVEDERVIPFTEQILFQNDEILVACKPHFLPVTPGGPYVNECLLNRLRLRTGLGSLAPIHRIDRETAGIVMFSVNKKTSNLYHELFRNGKVEKTYQAISEYCGNQEKTEWAIENRIVRGEPWFRMKTSPGEANARSKITLVEVKHNRGRFLLSPHTGKTHQLRLHMSGLGFKICNDKYYPDLQPESADDFSNPLQLIAKKLKFLDPVNGKEMEFVSERNLWE